MASLAGRISRCCWPNFDYIMIEKGSWIIFHIIAASMSRCESNGAKWSNYVANLFFFYYFVFIYFFFTWIVNEKILFKWIIETNTSLIDWPMKKENSIIPLDLKFLFMILDTWSNFEIIKLCLRKNLFSGGGTGANINCMIYETCLKHYEIFSKKKNDGIEWKR